MDLSELSESNKGEYNAEESNQNPDSGDKWRWSIYIGLIFLIIANSYTYSVTQKIFGSFVNMTIANVPTPAGIVIHCIVFVLLVRLLMNYKV